MRILVILLAFFPLFLHSQTGITFQVEELERPQKILFEKKLPFILNSIVVKELRILSEQGDPNYLNVDNPFHILAHGCEKDSLVNNDVFHPFFSGMYQAYADHRPFVISPDMIWLLISQGFSQHINNNAETLRHHFVDYEGKSTLIVNVGSSFNLKNVNDWETVFPQFTGKIEEFVGKELTENMTCNFSTTTITSKIASEITLMESMKPYFEYVALRMVCGIPEITLEGTSEDWLKVLNKVNYLRKYDLDWWVDEIEPVLKEFVNTSTGIVNKNFWRNMFKVHTKKEYGNPKVFDGWIVKFFPYNERGKKNDLKKINKWTELPREMVNVELKLIDVGDSGKTKELMLEIWAGFVGLSQNKDTYAIKPEIGWMVVDKQGNK